MLRRRRTALVTALAVVVAAAVTAGCGGGSRALALDPVSAAATKTQQAGAAHVRLTLALSSPQLTQSRAVTVRGTGAVDGTSAELTLSDLGSLCSTAPGCPAGANSPVTTIFLHQNGDYLLYVKSGLAATYLPADKQWVELDVTKLGASAGVDLDKVLSGAELQPSDLLSMLRASGAKISTVGPATIDGAATTHYRVTVDVAKALQAKGLTSPLFGGVATHVSTIPANVWIGQDGLVRRISISYAASQRHVHMTTDFLDYGAPVTIAAPASSAVFDATPLVQMGLAGGFTH
jgi:hypothetical protein